ncbi:hypothetical protein MLD38_019890 [Melastoma candidum]|uniref:Uncharacterized protein n=1 Tax=Melastoma candidum TaxID=119954 RepID=A0ACB9QBM2_9MYRT|nr:hypothetical protein MLD38_019890 [Melastoma candidum]
MALGSRLICVQFPVTRLIQSWQLAQTTLVFRGPETSREMNCHPFSWDLPVGVSSTNDVATRLGGLGGNNGADPRGFFYPNSMSRVDPGEGVGVVPLSGEGSSWDGPGFMPNLYSVSSYKVDQIVPTHANYSDFLGPGTICKMNGQPFSWGLPTDHVTSRLGVLGGDSGANPSHHSFSLLGRSTNSISKPFIGELDDSFSDHHTKVFSRDTCDDRLEETAVKYPLKGAQINGSYQLEGANLASQHAAGTCNSKGILFFWSSMFFKDSTAPEIKMLVLVLA